MISKEALDPGTGEIATRQLQPAIHSAFALKQ